MKYEASIIFLQSLYFTINTVEIICTVKQLSSGRTPGVNL